MLCTTYILSHYLSVSVFLKYTHSVNSHTLGLTYICNLCQFRCCINIAESTYRWRVQVLSHHYVSHSKSHTHTHRLGQAGHSGPRAVDCAKQVNIARTGFIRIEKALLLSGVSMTDWGGSLPPCPAPHSCPQLFREASTPQGYVFSALFLKN